MKYEVIIVWDDGSKNTHEYTTIEDAEKCERNYKTAFGGQVVFTGINKK